MRLAQPRRAAALGLALAFAAGAAALVACQQAGIGPRPIVAEQAFSVQPEALRKLAVVPFYPAPELTRSLAPTSQLAASDVADLVAGFLSDALSSQGFDVVPPNDVAALFAGRTLPLPRLDPRAAGPLISSEFGATAVLLGKVYRYREREGQALGTLKPASVGYELTLWDGKGTRRLWTARFDETQQPLTADVFNARRYPGGGRRWLTAAELARWGADGAAQALAAFR